MDSSKGPAQPLAATGAAAASGRIIKPQAISSNKSSPDASSSDSSSSGSDSDSSGSDSDNESDSSSSFGSSSSDEEGAIKPDDEPAITPSTLMPTSTVAADPTSSAVPADDTVHAATPVDAATAAAAARAKALQRKAEAFETIMQVPRRPGSCTVGVPTAIKANSFVVKMTHLDQPIYCYDLRCEPEAPSMRIRALFSTWRELYLLDLVDDQHKPKGAVPINVAQISCFDGKRALFTPMPLRLAPDEEKVYEVSLPMPNRQNQPKRRPFERVFTIKLRKLTEMPFRELHNYLQGIISREHSVFSYTSAVDVIFRQAATSFLSPQGRVLFDPRYKTTTGTGMEVMPGYTQAIRTAENHLIIILDVTSALFYESKPLSELLKIAFGRPRLGALSEQEVYMVERVMRGFSVMPNYQRDAPRRPYKIAALTRTGANATYFTMNGREMSVAAYFEAEYNRKLEFPDLPCVVAVVGGGNQQRGNFHHHGNNANDNKPVQIYLPVELCTMVEGQKVARPLGLMDIKHFKPSAMRPVERAQEIEKSARLVYDPTPPLLKSFHLGPEFQMLGITGRTLPAPRLLYHPTSREPVAVPVKGRWNMETHRMYRGVMLRKWAVLPLVPCQPDQVARFMTRWIGTMRDTGIHVVDPKPKILAPANPEEALETAIQHAYLQAGDQSVHPDLLVFILPERNYKIYTSIKRICDTLLGVASQCITQKVMLGMKGTHLENLCLKVNVKLPGGTNVRIDPEQLPCVRDIPTIFMGADVTHPAQEIRSPSIAAVVGSMDAFASQYAAVSRIQPIRAEIILDMGSMVLELLQKFYANTGAKPQRIIFYRDGISEGQFTEVIRSEVTAIRKACAALDPNYKPKLTFMIVQKRHHTRFFPDEGTIVDDRSGNLLPGLVVDSVVTHPFEFDFYIQSHLGLQGLAKPTRYSVLVDENNFSPNHLAELSYRMCYLYPRGTRSVSMVPAAFYAHVFAARAKCHVVDKEEDGKRFFALSAVKPELEKAMYFM
ncbi:hypothetical protein AMAG_16892 [Allomyces macrogynus ATCC 38327]|uniref:Piwi domain-containing protein n=1 Tax=Allomyces macrogynus (strain ATCC 38327) TaxID=578462 RepID=A0A0L0TD06_ALLM3|nr:hypothetical protein AMAG_16892 [Allomyces macrogynus ATCC 38327]|eukprot:KNE72409.1 hypothetical protein AMAG_16892 [Allomyces macrogynus ATCC 38327]